MSDANRTETAIRVEFVFEIKIEITVVLESISPSLCYFDSTWKTINFQRAKFAIVSSA